MNDAKIIIDIKEWRKMSNENFGLKIEKERLEKKYECLKEDYKMLKDEITTLYNLMIGMDVTNDYDNDSDDVEEI